MRASIEHGMVAVLVLSLGCLPAPAEVTTLGDDPSSGDSLAASTGAGSITSDGSATAGTSVASEGSGSTGTATGDASSDSGSGDSSTGEPMDVPLGPFGEPVAVTELNAAGNEDDPSLTGDMLEIYFNSNRYGNEDVFVSTRASVDDAWAMPMPVAEVNSFSTETFPEVSTDGLVLLLASDRLVPTDLDVYYSWRNDRSQPWSAPMPLTGAARPGLVDWGATPTPDMTRVLLCSEEGGIGQSDIWEATADFTGWVVGSPTHLDPLASTVAECSSTLSLSEREIFFETTRPTGLSWSIWTATREEPTEPWGDPSAVEELENGFDEVDPWLSPDRRTLWFARGTVGAYDLYVATRR